MKIKREKEQDPVSGRYFAAVGVCDRCGGDVVLDGIPAICVDCKKAFIAVSIEEIEQIHEREVKRHKGQPEPNMRCPDPSQLRTIIQRLWEIQENRTTDEADQDILIKAINHLEHLDKAIGLWSGESEAA